jgi:hypothetical protein
MSTGETALALDSDVSTLTAVCGITAAASALEDVAELLLLEVDIWGKTNEKILRICLLFNKLYIIN